MMPYFNRFVTAALIALLVFSAISLMGSFNKSGGKVSFPQNAEIVASASHVNTDILCTMSASALDDMFKASHELPIFIMVYASWCPHCKKMFPELNQLQQELKAKIRIVTLSIDNRAEQAEAYVRGFSPLNVETYAIRDGGTYRAVGEKLRAIGLHFQGGITSNVPVPYSLVLYKGKAVAEVAGAIPPENIRKLVGDVVANAK